VLGTRVQYQKQGSCVCLGMASDLALRFNGPANWVPCVFIVTFGWLWGSKREGKERH